MLNRHLLQGNWRHSHEEDSDDTLVYRRRDFRFPPSRGRHGFELRPDGTGTDHSLAPGDGNAEVSVTWAVAPDGTVVLTDPSGKVVRKMCVASASKDKLVFTRQIA
jgi:hypothetical protein